MQRWRSVVGGHPWAADVGVGAAVAAVILLTTAASPTGDAGLTWPAALTAVVAGGALVLRRRFPFAVLAVTAVAAELYLVQYHGFQGTMVVAAPLVALYTVADTSPRWRALAAAVLVILFSGVLHMFVAPQSWLGSDNLALAALGGLAIAAGSATRHRRAWLAEARARVAQAEVEAVRRAGEAEADANRRVTDERLRIARDLHDAVGHQLALISVQARVAAHVLDSEPQQARQAMAHVHEASRVALGELADTIGLLRQPGEPAEPPAPAAGLAALDALLAGFRRSGLTIEAHTDGVPTVLPAPVDLTGYRVVQEALTNICKHAGPSRVRVRLSYRLDALRVAVENEPTGRPPGSAAGHGLVGMRERVNALGGRLAAGPRPDGGYRVSAVLPLTRYGAHSGGADR